MSQYHRSTAYQRGSLNGHSLDWSQQPHPFKRYRHIEPQPLPQAALPQAAFFDLALGWPSPQQPQAPRAEQVAAALLLGAGITALSRGPGQSIGLRAPASAGALYPAELYLAVQETPGLEPGLYHFAPEVPGLHPLWPGQLASALGAALGQGPSRLTFIITALYWRSLWKYRSRAYRYCLLDAGHLLANLELALLGLGLAPLVHSGFADSTLAMLLGLATSDEAALCALSAGGTPDQAGPAQPGLPPLDLQALPLSARVDRDPQILAAHAAGNLKTPQAPEAWPDAPPPAGALELPPPQPGGADLDQVVRSRRSRRNFLPLGLERPALSRLLAAALPAAGPLEATVLLPALDWLDEGAYRYYPGAHALAPAPAEPQARRWLARACLDQLWVGQASLVLVLWADLTRLEELGGPRSYRQAMLAAGRAGQRLYLAATALGLGCCGVGAFYDDEVSRVLDLPAEASPLYLLACGPVKGGLG